jgi:hypothetical protein
VGIRRITGARQAASWVRAGERVVKAPTFFGPVKIEEGPRAEDLEKSHKEGIGEGEVGFSSF